MCRDGTAWPILPCSLRPRFASASRFGRLKSNRSPRWASWSMSFSARHRAYRWHEPYRTQPLPDDRNISGLPLLTRKEVLGVFSLTSDADEVAAEVLAAFQA